MNNNKPVPTFHIGGKYNWKGQPERLVYLGDNWSGNGYWHQFEKVDEPGVVWCEVKGYELSNFEETAPPAPIPDDNRTERERWNDEVDARKAARKGSK